PRISSTRKKLLIKSRTALMGDTYPLEPRAHARQDESGLDDQPDQRDRDQHLPAQPHDLIVAIAREGRSDPEVAELEEADLQAEPDDTRHHVEDRSQHRNAVERRIPAAQEGDGSD